MTFLFLILVALATVAWYCRRAVQALTVKSPTNQAFLHGLSLGRGECAENVHHIERRRAARRTADRFPSHLNAN